MHLKDEKTNRKLALSIKLPNPGLVICYNTEPGISRDWELT